MSAREVASGGVLGASRGLLAAAALCALAAPFLRAGSSVVAADPASVAATQAQAKKPRPFPHTSHVADRWYYRGGRHPGDPKPSAAEHDRLEVARDCRGCHDHGARDESGRTTRAARDPLAGCADCHYPVEVDGATRDVLKVEVQPGFAGGLRAARASTSAFDHLDHDNLACRQCHAQSEQDPESFGGATGVPACMECHTEGAEAREWDVLAGRSIDKSKLRAGFLAWLDRDASMRAPGRGPYPHDRHIPPGQRRDGASCVACHGEVGSATALDLHLKEHSAQECARCHIQSDGAPVKVETVLEKRASVAALSFAHADHARRKGAAEDLAVVVAGSSARLESNGCLECHEHVEHARIGPDGAPTPPTYMLRADRDEYSDCMSCHDVPAYRAPHHGRWDSCSACHDMEAGSHAAFKERRPTTLVDRLPPGAARFVADPQRHPGLADRPDQDCAACHRAPLPALPSRVDGARFEHASHLPPEPTTQDCLACHPSILDARSSGAIGLPWDAASAAQVEPARRASFSMDGCSSCHPGIRLDAASLPEPAPRAATTFDHAAQLAKALDPRTGAKVSCASCHDFDPAARGAGIGVAAKALSCVECHAHDEARAATTGGVGADEAASCARCHEDSLPSATRPMLVDRARVALQGAQHHPAGKGCNDCHLDEPPGRLEAVLAVLASYPHGKGQHSRDAGGRPQGGCSDCHWSKAPPGYPEASVDAAERKRAGDSLSDFPGGARRRAR
ncbi:MAG: hypothetical protein RL112_1927 [Planctomycetota bacterium]